MNKNFMYIVSDHNQDYSLEADWPKPAKNGDTSTWRIRHGQETAKPGDWIWVYHTRPHQAIRAVGRVNKRPYKAGEDWVVEILWDGELSMKLLNNPIPRRDIETQNVRASLMSVNIETQKVIDSWKNSV